MTVEYLGLVDYVAVAAASGDWGHEEAAAWLRDHLMPPTAE